jgi:hypothetical protein
MVLLSVAILVLSGAVSAISLNATTNVNRKNNGGNEAPLSSGSKSLGVAPITMPTQQGLVPHDNKYPLYEESRGYNVVFDNGLFLDIYAAAMVDTVGGTDEHHADDFLKWTYYPTYPYDGAEWCIDDVHWYGMYSGYFSLSNYGWQDLEWNIVFYEDDGTGNAPGTVYAGPFVFGFDDLEKTILYDGTWDKEFIFRADFCDTPVCFPGCGEKFWIEIYAEGDMTYTSGSYVYPMWTYVGCHFPTLHHMAVYRSDYYGPVDWTDTLTQWGVEIDIAFWLTKKFEFDADAIEINIDTTDWCECVPVNVTVANLGSTDLTNVPVNVVIKEQYMFWPDSFGWMFDPGAWLPPNPEFVTDGALTGFIWWPGTFDTSAACNPMLCFDMWHDHLGSDDYVQVAIDTGSGWMPATPDMFYRVVCPGCDTGWVRHCVELPKDPNLMVGFFAFADALPAAYPLILDNVELADIAYDETLLVDIPICEEIVVDFPDFCPCQWGTGLVAAPDCIDYIATACTQLVGDDDPGNDCTPPLFFTLCFPYLHDVGVEDKWMTGECNEYEICATIRNYGQYEECCFKVYAALYEPLPPAYVPPGVLYYEDFEHGGAMPAGWTQYQFQGSDFWDIEMYGVNWHDEPPITGSSGTYFLEYDDDENGGFYTNEVMVFTQSLDMTDMDSVWVDFDFVIYDYWEDMGVYTFSGGTDPFTNLEENLFYDWGYLKGHQTLNFDPSGYAHPDDVYIGFYYYDYGYWEYVAAVDELVVSYDGYWTYPGVSLVWSDWFCVDILPVCDEITICFEKWIPDIGTNCACDDYWLEVWTALCDPMDEDPSNDMMAQWEEVCFAHDIELIAQQPSKSEPWYFHEFIGDQDYSFYPGAPTVWTPIGAPDTDFLCGGTWAKGAWYQYSGDTEEMFIRDTTTGAKNLVKSLTGDADMSGVAFDGIAWWGCTFNGLMSIDLATGVCTQLYSPAELFIDMAIDVDTGLGYGHDLATDQIFEIDLSTGTTTAKIGTGHVANYAQGMEFDNENDICYLLLFDASDYHTYLIGYDPATNTIVSDVDMGYYIECDAFAIPYVSIIWLPCGEHTFCVNVTNVGTFDEVDDPSTICDYEGVTVEYTLIEYYLDECDPCGPYLEREILTGVEEFELLCGDTYQVCFTYDFTVSGLFGIKFEGFLYKFMNVDCNLLDNEAELVVGIDCCDPMSEHTTTPALPDGCNNWYTKDVTITITAFDPLCPDPCYGFASGIKEIHYELNGVPTVKAGETVTFKISDEGVNLVEYWSVDNLGNVEDPFTFEVAIDKSKPDIDLIYEKIEDGTLQVKFTAVASDSISGIQKVEFYIGANLEGTLTAAPFTWTITWDDAYKTQTFKAKVFDAACNTAEDSVFGGDIPGAKALVNALTQTISRTNALTHSALGI